MTGFRALSQELAVEEHSAVTVFQMTVGLANVEQKLWQRVNTVRFFVVLEGFFELSEPEVYLGLAKEFLGPLGCVLLVIGQHLAGLPDEQ